MSVVKVGIIGATGYTGSELLRILSRHPQAEISVVTARSEAGKAVSDFFPHLRGAVDFPFTTPDDPALGECDVVFFATPHGVAMQDARALLEKGVKVIDLSADFRIKDTAIFEKWYGIPHTAPDLLAEAVYGLPETHREDIKTARLIGNPGCYPTAVQLGFKPLIDNGLINYSPLIADVKSGVSGAGRGAKVANLYTEMGDSFKAYGASGHRHQPEIEQELSLMASSTLNLTFVPHLVPMIRGIEATLYAPLKNTAIDTADIHAAFVATYKDEYFVDVMNAGAHPDTRSVRGSNTVRIGVHRSVDGTLAIITVVEDNLVKGAAGQAVQCMNLMFGLAENSGLTQLALMP